MAKSLLSARVTTEFAGREIQIRGVLIDAQTTGGVPTGTTLGVNGLSSDLIDFEFSSWFEWFNSSCFSS